MGQKMPVIRIDLSNCPTDATWYTVATLYNYEKKYATDLMTGLAGAGLEGKIIDIIVPFKEIEYEATSKTGKKSKKIKVEEIMPLYVFVKAYMNEQVWDYMRNTTGANTILAASGSPSIMTDAEAQHIKDICGIKNEKKVSDFAGQIGDKVIITAGPFALYKGIIHDIYFTKNKVKVVLDNGMPLEVNINEVQIN